MNNTVLRRLCDICEEKLRTSLSVRSKDYDHPSWSHKQAHDNGRAEALEEILELLSFVERNKR